MSLPKLDRAIDRLPPKRPIGPGRVEDLKEATGEKIGRREAGRLGSLLQTDWRRFTATGIDRLEVLAGVAAPGAKAIPFSLAGTYKTGVPEQSALRALPGGLGFMTVSDDSGQIVRVTVGAQGKVSVTPMGEYEELDGLEGAAFDRDEGTILVLSEDSRKVWEMELGAGGLLGEPDKLGKLEAVGELENKGWEGIDVLPASQSPDGHAKLLAVNEGSPRGVGVFDRDTLELEGFARLPRALKEQAPDLSDLAFDRKSGRLFLLSHEGNAVFQTELVRTRWQRTDPDWSLVLYPGKIALPGSAATLQAEGLDFDAKGDLWVAGEIGSKLLHYARD